MTVSSEEKIPFWRDDRFWRIAIQVIVIAVVVIIALIAYGNMNRNMGRGLQFNFLRQSAGFNIGEAIVPYTTNDRYAWALTVGFLNTLRLIFVGFVVATVVGLVAGVASFSDNWLVRNISRVYVEIIRNTPLLLQLFFWYFAVFFGLAGDAGLARLPGSIFISKKGIYIPFPGNTLAAWLSAAVLVAGAIVAYFVWQRRTKVMSEEGSDGKRELMILSAIGLVSLLVFLFGLGWNFPRLVTPPDTLAGGLRMSLEYGAMLFGLAFYTGAFIAEIVRAGIQSVSQGQWEAAKALGLHNGLAMRLVVFPQALRVIIPSLNSQYMNLAKNSSLALAIGYPDIFSTAQTTLNQTGRAVEVILLVMSTYLVVNLIISIVMNQLNRVVQLKER
ncbi:MAG: ABC transporter permease subunit [Leptolyngbyaceae cyanobacterium SM1_3_5]|nr:ABC transporter permease subunit [Leptolyngbyaceae cyanobacterium SM1_3_5]